MWLFLSTVVNVYKENAQVYYMNNQVVIVDFERLEKRLLDAGLKGCIVQESEVKDKTRHFENLCSIEKQDIWENTIKSLRQFVVEPYIRDEFDTHEERTIWKENKLKDNNKYLWSQYVNNNALTGTGISAVAIRNTILVRDLMHSSKSINKFLGLISHFTDTEALDYYGSLPKVEDKIAYVGNIKSCVADLLESLEIKGYDLLKNRDINVLEEKYRYGA